MADAIGAVEEDRSAIHTSLGDVHSDAGNFEARLTWHAWRDAKNGGLLSSPARAEAIGWWRADVYEICLNYLRPLFS